MQGLYYDINAFNFINTMWGISLSINIIPALIVLFIAAHWL